MQKVASRKEIILLLSSLAILILLVLFNKRPPFFDEALYLRDVEVLHRYGFSRTFLLELTGSAGPLYAVIHYLLEPLTQLKPPLIRVVNIFFLLGTIHFTNRIAVLSGLKVNQVGLYIMAIPMSYVVAGLALTEMPAMFFLSLGLFLIIYTTTKEDIPPSLQFALIVIGGVSFSISITGRQPYLLLLGALPVLFTQNFNQQWMKKIILMLTLMLSSLSLPLVIFWIWNGLVPPTDAMLYDEIAKNGTPYRLDFFFLCIAYYAISIVFISPDYFKKESKQNMVILIGLLIISTLNYIFHFVVYLPFHGVTKRIFISEESQSIAGIFIGAILILATVIFLLRLFQHMLCLSKSRLFLFYSLSLLLIAISCTKITWGFSSRYPAQALPFIALIGGFFYKEGRTLLFPAIGILSGIYSLLSYLFS